MPLPPLPVYMHIPKTGGTSYCSALMHAFPGPSRFSVMGTREENAARAAQFAQLSPERHNRLRIAFGHKTEAFHSMTARPVRYFATVRHPFDRMKSSYRQHVRHCQQTGKPVPALADYLMGFEKRIWHYFLSDAELASFRAAGAAESEIRAAARLRIDQQYAAIGIMEDMDRSVCLYNLVFGFDIYQIDFLNASPPATVASHDAEAQASEALLADRLAEDVAFYDDLKARFEAHWRSLPDADEALATFRAKKRAWQQRNSPLRSRIRKVLFELKRKRY